MANQILREAAEGAFRARRVGWGPFTQIAAGVGGPGRCGACRVGGNAAARLGFRIACDNDAVRLRERNLIDQIEQGALDGEAPISGTLRKVLALGGKVGSKELRDWASLELRGYAGSDVEPPQYRKSSAAIMVDFSNLQYMVKGQQIGRHQLPEPIREHVDEQCPVEPWDR